MKKLLKFLGFRRCILCNKYELIFFGRLIKWTDDGELDYCAFTCNKCISNIRED